MFNWLHLNWLTGKHELYQSFQEKKVINIIVCQPDSQVIRWLDWLEIRYMQQKLEANSACQFNSTVTSPVILMREEEQLISAFWSRSALSSSNVTIKFQVDFKCFFGCAPLLLICSYRSDARHEKSIKEAVWKPPFFCFTLCGLCYTWEKKL